MFRQQFHYPWAMQTFLVSLPTDTVQWYGLLLLKLEERNIYKKLVNDRHTITACISYLFYVTSKASQQDTVQEAY